MEINQDWTLRFSDPKTGKVTTVPAMVPGNVLGDLQRAGVLPDLYFGCNSLLTRPYEFIDWEYRTVFDAPSVAPGETVELRFDGIDTVADVFLNGEKIGHCENMFVEHCFDVTGTIRPGVSNELTVKIASSVNYARKYTYSAYANAQTYNYEGLYLRRPQHTYGWDIAPRLVGAGIWRKVSLQVLKPTRWTDTWLVSIEANRKFAEVVLTWSFTSEAVSLEGFEGLLKLRCGDSYVEQRFPLFFVNGRKQFRMEKPILWWPRGSGEAAMYDVELSLLHNGKVVDVVNKKFGVREIRLIRTEVLDAAKKGEFYFQVNGERIFIKGSNWVPADALHGEERERIVNALKLFEDLNCNMARCWGGNVYESEEFFDECDRAGIMVWQDFMFACERVPLDDEFLARVREEARKVIMRLRHHPSLAVWCGDNECDEHSFYGPWKATQKPSFNRITREVLPQALIQYDPSRDYLPSSPFLSDECWSRKDRYSAPEQHLWGPRDSWKNPFYKDNCAIFASEVGYHGMSSVESMKKFLPAESLNGRVGNRDWLCHASQTWALPDGGCAYRIKLMEKQVANAFGSVPEKLEDYILASQIVQAEAMKFMVENFRMNKWKKSGLIWWNVIDCWPQFSDAIVDYYGDRKLAYYYIRNIQKPVVFMFDEPASWGIRLHASNDDFQPVAGTYKVTELLTGKVEMEGEFELDGNSAAEVGFLPICQGQLRMLLIEWTIDGVTSCNHYMQSPALLNLEEYRRCLELLKPRYC